MKRGSDAVQDDTFQSQKASRDDAGKKTNIKSAIGSKNTDLYYLALQNLNSSFTKEVTARVTQNAHTLRELEAEEYLCREKDLRNQFQNVPGNVYAFGMGDTNQLGIDFDYSKPNKKSTNTVDSDDEDYTDKSAYVPTLLRHIEQVSSISCGSLHSAVCTDGGKVFTWGMSDEGSLGRTATAESEALPMLVEALSHEHIVRVACGTSQTLALTSKGQVFEWGCYKDMEAVRYCSPDPKAAAGERHLSITSNGGINQTPVLLVDLKNIVDFACGASCSYARASTGEVYSWGIGESGELGRELTKYNRDLSPLTIYNEYLKPGSIYRGDLSSSSKPSEASKVKFARAFACGANHVLIVVSGGIVLSCGLNNYNQLGLETEKNQPNKLFYEISSLRDKNIVSVSAGQFHSLCLSATGDIWGFGRIDYGQLGFKVIDQKKDFGMSTHIPTLVSASKDVVFASVACGDNHNVAVTTTGAAYAWGYNDGGQLGLGETEAQADACFPQKIAFEGQVLKVSCGSQHSCFIANAP